MSQDKSYDNVWQSGPWCLHGNSKQ